MSGSDHHEHSESEVALRSATGDAPAEVRTLGASARAISAATVILVLAAVGTLMAFGYGEEARRLPIVVGVPLSAMALANLIGVTRDEHRARKPRVATVARVDEAVGPDDERPVVGESGLEDGTADGLSFRLSAASVGLIAVLFFFLGLIPTAVLYTVGFMRAVGRERWSKSFVTAGLLVLMFWAFRNFLNVRFYRGWLASEGFIPYFLPF